MRYQCKTCKKIYGRHSKSIKIQYQRCGVCTGELFLLPQLKADGTPMKKRAPSEWQLFCKKNMARDGNLVSAVQAAKGATCLVKAGVSAGCGYRRSQHSVAPTR
eukprot:gene11126-7340_t